VYIYRDVHTWNEVQFKFSDVACIHPAGGLTEKSACSIRGNLTRLASIPLLGWQNSRVGDVVYIRCVKAFSLRVRLASIRVLGWRSSRPLTYGGKGRFTTVATRGKYRTGENETASTKVYEKVTTCNVIHVVVCKTTCNVRPDHSSAGRVEGHTHGFLYSVCLYM
jgi:hypothetical protein